MLLFSSLLVVGLGLATAAVLLEPNGSPNASQAVRLGLDYLARASNDTDQTSPLLLVYLNRKFQLKIDTAPIIDHLKSTMDEQSRPFLRLADPSFIITPNVVAQASRFSRLGLSALACDRIPLPASFLDELNQLAAAGGYELSHAALALDWAVDIGCISPKQATPYLQSQNRGLAAIIDQHPLTNDLPLEAMAILLNRDQPDLVDKGKIAQLRLLQHDNGGWGLDGPKSNIHATVITLWILLENERPDTRDQPMVAVQ